MKSLLAPVIWLLLLAVPAAAQSATSGFGVLSAGFPVSKSSFAEAIELNYPVVESDLTRLLFGSAVWLSPNLDLASLHFTGELGPETGSRWRVSLGAGYLIQDDWDLGSRWLIYAAAGLKANVGGLLDLHFGFEHVSHARIAGERNPGANLFSLKLGSAF